MFRKIIVTILLSALVFPAFSSHYMGGEITWECLPNGNFRFVMKYYRECDGINFGASYNLSVSGHPSVTSIALNRISQTDISPACNPDPNCPSITCASVTAPNMGAIEEHIYTSDQAYPNGVQLAGVPPASGWVFYHESCCRNPSTNITGATGYGWRLRAVMYPYNGQNNYPCWDNSPTFAEKPATVICSGYPFTYNHNAFDKELDSLSYEWAQPLDYSCGGCVIPAGSYAYGYSYQNPLPGTVHNPANVPDSMSPYTGEIFFTSYTQGAFVTVTKVTAYRCGVKVAEIFREMQVVILNCAQNNPPNVGAPFIGNINPYVDTVYAGDFVSFSMTGLDFDQITCANNFPQTLSLTASGSQFGQNYTNTTTGCLNPPCATLNPPPPVSAYSGVSTSFEWQTDCEHLITDAGCGNTSNVYNFIIKVQDDFCPAPAIKVSTVTIVVINPPVHGPPEIHCVAVDNAGDVTLSWTPPDTGNMNTFYNYQIYYSPNPNGPFNAIDSVFNYFTTSYVHAGANAQTTPGYYYMQTMSGCYGMFASTESDTAHVMEMNVTNSGLGTADLSWNSIYDPPLPTQSLYYHIYREYPPGTWMLLDSTTNLNYTDTVTLCNAFINYRVEVYDSAGCYSVSTLDGDLFADQNAPAIPILDSVSVDTVSMKTILGWKQSLNPDTEGYIIYQNIGGIWTPIDTIWGIGSTSFLNPASDPGSGSETYRIAAFDSCWNTSPMGTEHSTIYLTTVMDVCDDKVTLNWTPYANMDPPLGGYDIFYSENGNPMQLLSTVPAGASDYTHTGLAQSAEYCYVIRAYDAVTGNLTSTSNPTCLLAVKPKQPQFLYLKVATVNQDPILNVGDYAEIRAFVDTSAYVTEYRLKRSDDNVSYTVIDTKGPSNNPIISFIDYTAQIRERSYYYKVSVIDSCGVEAQESDQGRTILLTVTANSDLTNTLEWNDYEDWPSGVAGYNLYRQIDGVLDMTPIAQLPFGVNSHIDDVSQFSSSEGKFIYHIEALEAAGNPYGFADTSISNTPLALQYPRFFVPNAFSPKGYNSIFRPIGVFVDHTDYILQIYNRWGEMIFESQDYFEGWNGQYKGSIARGGVYVYFVRFRSSGGEYFEKHGTVTLIR